MDTLKVELLARTREKRVLKNRLQELVDYGEGLDVKKDWMSGRADTALRLMLKVAREKVRVEGNEFRWERSAELGPSWHSQRTRSSGGR